MASTGFTGGPYPLTPAEVQRRVTRKSPGAYALGKTDPKDSNFIVQYAGRSDDDVAGRLSQHANNKAYPEFKFGYFDSAKAAFERECAIYHDFGESKSLGNDVHPARPKNTNLVCPICGK
jgi:hypothetical protein